MDFCLRRIHEEMKKRTKDLLMMDVISLMAEDLRHYIERRVFDETSRYLSNKKRNVRQVNAHVRNSLIDWNLFE